MPRSELWYDPGATAPVEMIVTGVVGDVQNPGGSPSASIAAPDRAAIQVSAAGSESFDLLYHKPTYIDPQPGQVLACALTANACAGVFPLAGDRIRLPTGARVDIATFAASAIGRPIVDFFGIRAPLE